MSIVETCISTDNKFPARKTFNSMAKTALYIRQHVPVRPINIERAPIIERLSDKERNENTNCRDS